MQSPPNKLDFNIRNLKLCLSLLPVVLILIMATRLISKIQMIRFKFVERETFLTPWDSNPRPPEAIVALPAELQGQIATITLLLVMFVCAAL